MAWYVQSCTIVIIINFRTFSSPPKETSDPVTIISLSSHPPTPDSHCVSYCLLCNTIQQLKTVNLNYLMVSLAQESGHYLGASNLRSLVRLQLLARASISSEGSTGRGFCFLQVGLRASVPCLMYLYVCIEQLETWQLAEQGRKPKMEATVLLVTNSEATYHHICHILLTASPRSRPHS